jgi:hypothetical protein
MGGQPWEGFVPNTTRKTDEPRQTCGHPFVSGFRYLLRSAQGQDLGEYVVARPDWSEGDTLTDKEGRRFRIVSIDPGRILGAIHGR